MTTSIPHPRLDLLRALQAENLLGDSWPVYNQIKDIPNKMVWKGITYPQFFEQLQERIATIGQIQLKHCLTEIDAGDYLVDVTMSYERVLDGINQRMVEATAFQAHMKSNLNRLQQKMPGFLVLWSIGAQDILESSLLSKIKEADVKFLAAQQFSVAVQEADLDLQALIEAMDVCIDNLKSAKKLADMKYSMAKDQVNAVLAGLDIPDRGTGAHSPETHGQGATTALRGMFGDRVKASESKPTHEELDEELPMFNPPAPAQPEEVPALSVDLDEVTSPEGISQSAPEEETVLANTAVASTGHPALEKPARGGAIQVPYNLSIQSPGALEVPDHIVARGKSKVQLTAQLDPAENGIYRWMGPDVPMERLEEKATPKKAAPETPQDPSGSESSPEEARPVTTETVPTKDPFSTVSVTHSGAPQTTGLGIELDEDLPVAPKKAEELDEDLPLGVQSSRSTTGAELDEDLPVPPAPKPALDEDDDFPVGMGIINKTPASQELAEGIPGGSLSSDVAEPPVEVPASTVEVPREVPAAEVSPAQAVEAPKPQPAAQPAAAPKDIKPTAPVGNLFRPRALAPGQVACPTFRVKPVPRSEEAL